MKNPCKEIEVSKNIIPIEEQSSQALAARVVAFRILNIGRDDAIKAMQELCSRKESGDEFDYEKYIKDKIDELPEASLGKDKLDIKMVLKNVKSGTF